MRLYAILCGLVAAGVACSGTGFTSIDAQPIDVHQLGACNSSSYAAAQLGYVPTECEYECVTYRAGQGPQCVGTNGAGSSHECLETFVGTGSDPVVGCCWPATGSNGDYAAFFECP